MEYPLFDFKDFSDISDFDFKYNGNNIMVNEAATNLSKGIEGIGSTSGSNNNQPVIDEPNSNQILLAPTSGCRSGTSTSIDLNSFGDVSHHNNSNPLHEEMLPKDRVYMTQPVYSECRVNSVEANQFNSHIGSSLPEDGVYTTQLVYLKCRVHLVKSNNLNGHIGSSLLKDGVYTAKSVYLECKVNSLQEKTLNGYVGSSLQDEILSTQREDLVNPGRRVTFADQFQQNNGNNNSNGNQQPLVYPNLTP
ncbi:hypothetical protein GOBAR_AA00999 [Gossypium barbadense]|uniref:Uncharacterized protein n=1 Tax=Gossypium barbadense TaxID=3634 RepID=A0A2P5YVK4_GOSBA|nr:hypothetical protein GOBAR_AA00999 [Gossypium barbadense]